MSLSFRQQLLNSAFLINPLLLVRKNAHAWKSIKLRGMSIPPEKFRKQFANCCLSVGSIIFYNVKCVRSNPLNLRVLLFLRCLPFLYMTVNFRKNLKVPPNHSGFNVAEEARIHKVCD